MYTVVEKSDLKKEGNTTSSLFTLQHCFKMQKLKTYRKSQNWVESWWKVQLILAEVNIVVILFSYSIACAGSMSLLKIIPTAKGVIQIYFRIPNVKKKERADVKKSIT